MDEELESFLTAHQEYGHFNNTVLVFQSDESIFARGYGEAVREHGIPNAVEIKYNIASYTKQFCAETVLRLVQDGRLSSEQTIDKWYPEQTSASKITIYHLLTIPSGIPNVTVVAGSDKVEHWIRDPTTGERVAPPWVGKGPRVLIGEERQVVGTEARAF